MANFQISVKLQISNAKYKMYSKTPLLWQHVTAGTNYTRKAMFKMFSVINQIPQLSENAKTIIYQEI